MASNRKWKEFEARAADLFGGGRFWSNSGESVDFESTNVVGQCKLVKRISGNELSDLAEQAEREARARQKAGVVCFKIRRGPGNKSPMLIVMTEASWRLMHGDHA